MYGQTNVPNLNGVKVLTKKAEEERKAAEKAAKKKAEEERKAAEKAAKKKAEEERKAAEEAAKKKNRIASITFSFPYQTCFEGTWRHLVNGIRWIMQWTAGNAWVTTVE